MLENGYYATVEHRHELQTSLSNIQRSLQDAVAASALELLEDARSEKAEMDVNLEQIRTTSVSDTTAVDAFQLTLDEYFNSGMNVTRRFINGDLDDSVFDDLTRVNDVYAELQATLEETIRADRLAVEQGFESVVAEQSGATTSILAVICVVTAFLLIMSFYIIRSTTKAISSAVDHISALSRGDLTHRVREVSNDEFGQMTAQVGDVTRTIGMLTSQVTELIDAVRNGRLDKRGEPEQFSGTYAELVSNVNLLIDALVSPIGLTADYVEAISSGSIPPEISEHFGGDFDKIKQNLNTLVRTMNGLVEQTGSLTRAAKQGQLETRGNCGDFSGAWSEMIQGMNETLDAVITPIQEVSDCMSQLAEGSLTWRASDGYKGQFALLCNDTNTTGQKLNTVIGSIRAAAGTIQQAVGEVAAGNGDLSRRTESQAASLEEARANIEEMTHVVVANAENAQEANDVAVSTREMAEKGERIVSEAVTAMTEISEASENVVAIIDLIDTIAFQTNLLALNASVEAARAGEQGRGFAVVAAEVRQLAGRSASAASEIKQLIHDSANRVRKGEQLVRTSGETLGTIMESVKRVTNLVGEISGASQDQRRGIEEVNSVVINLDQMTQENANLVVEIAATSESIGHQVENLTHLLAFFDVSDDSQQHAPVEHSGFEELDHAAGM